MDLKKITAFKRQFMPSALPDEVFESGLYRIGDDVTPEQFNYEQRQRAMQQQAFASAPAVESSMDPRRGPPGIMGGAGAVGQYQNYNGQSVG